MSDDGDSQSEALKPVGGIRANESLEVETATTDTGRVTCLPAEMQIY